MTKTDAYKEALRTLATTPGLPFEVAMDNIRANNPITGKPFDGSSDGAVALATALFKKIRSMDDGADRWRANAALWNQRAVKAYNAAPDHFNEWSDKPRYDNFQTAYANYFATFKSLWELVRSAKQQDEYIYWYFASFSRELIKDNWKLCKKAAYPDFNPDYDDDAWETGDYLELNF